jgi:hypothetical protein
MPIIECTCGMVMSLATEDSRTYCIRCGRAARHDSVRGQANRNSGAPANARRTHTQLAPLQALDVFVAGESAAIERYI